MVLVYLIANGAFSAPKEGVMGKELDHRPRAKVYFMFTTIPPHAHRIALTLDILRYQTLVPDNVILNVPNKYRRFNGTLPLEGRGLPGDTLRIHKLEQDSGPLSKYLAATACDDNDIVIIGDDDQDYSATFIEDFVSVVEGNEAQDTIFSGDIDQSFGSYGLMGFSGVAGRAWMFKQLPQKVPESCFLADDVFVTHYAQRMGLKILRMLKRHRDKRSHDQKDATSINHYVKEHGEQVYKGCAQELREHPLVVTPRTGPVIGGK